MKTKKLKAAFTAGTPAPGQPVGFYLNKLLNLHQLQFLPLKALNLVESLVSHIRWIAPSPRKGGHTLESMSMDMKSIGAPNVPREDDGVTISPRDTTNGSSCSLSTKKSRNRKLHRSSRGKLKQLLQTTIRDLPIRVSQCLVLCTVVQSMHCCCLSLRCFLAPIVTFNDSSTMNPLEVSARHCSSVCGHFYSS